MIKKHKCYWNKNAGVDVYATYAYNLSAKFTQIVVIGSKCSVCVFTHKFEKKMSNAVCRTMRL